MSEEGRPRFDPHRARFELWARDTFDREADAHLDREGTGLVAGLVELWRSVLREGVLDSGGASFTAFSLVLTDGDEADTTDLGVQPFDNRALAKLRRWIHGQPVLDAREGEMLRALATTHAALLPTDGRFPSGWQERSEARRILAEVEEAGGVDEMLERLARLRG
jgi:hypothetical protein